MHRSTLSMGHAVMFSFPSLLSHPCRSHPLDTCRTPPHLSLSSSLCPHLPPHSFSSNTPEHHTPTDLWVFPGSPLDLPFFPRTPISGSFLDSLPLLLLFHIHLHNHCFSVTMHLLILLLSLIPCTTIDFSFIDSLSLSHCSSFLLIGLPYDSSS